MSSKYRIIPIGGGGGITPTGTLDIRSEGVFDVTDYASVDVDIFDDTTTKTITNNGTYNASDDHVLGYSQVTVDVPASAVDTGTLTIEPITQNVNLFTQDVTGYRAIAFEVAVPNGTETTTITANGTYTPTSPNIGFAEVTVNVPNGTETITITDNGTYTPTSPNIGFSEVTVNVTPQEPDYFNVFPTGTTSSRYIALSPVTGNAGNRPVIYYSTNKIDWVQWTSGSVSFSSAIYFYGENPVGMHGWGMEIGGGEVAVRGNIQTLIDRYATRQDAPAHAFELFFQDQLNLKYGSTLTLGATYLSDSCYNSMFQGCRNLISAPVISAMELADSSCQCMFQNCTSLTQVDRLPATELAPSCYGSMFSGCTSLATVPSNMLPASQMKQSCYAQMFSGCYMLTTPPKLNSISLAESCYAQMFSGCSNPNFTPPELPATTLAPSCYDSMFNGCFYITESPRLVATTLATGCYNSMFQGCGRLNKVYLSYAGQDWDTGGGYSQYAYYWLYGVASTGTIINGGNANLPLNDVNGVPTGWTMTQADYFYIDNPNTRAQTLNAVPISSSTDLSLITTLEYSTDATNWTSWTASGGSMPSVSIPANSKLYLRTSSPLNTSGAQGISFRVTCGGIGDGVTLHGDIRTLVNYTNPNLDTLDNAELYMLFDQQGAGIMIYNAIHDASDIDFSGLKVVANMGRMFRNNQYMTGAPNLSSISARHATTTFYGYEQMYYNCKRLKDITAPKGPSNNFSASDWVYGVAATGTMHVPTNQTMSTGSSGIPSGWTRVDY